MRCWARLATNMLLAHVAAPGEFTGGSPVPRKAGGCGICGFVVLCCGARSGVLMSDSSLPLLYHTPPEWAGRALEDPLALLNNHAPCG